MGKVGLPAPVSELAARDWDVVVVGGGHNGLTASAYLARAGHSVLVCERRERLGGACTLEQPFSDPRYLVSPCAYVVGLLDELVVRELGLESRGYEAVPADPNLWCPLPDGSSVALFLDRNRTASHLRAQGFGDRDIEGLFACEDMFDRLRRRLRGGPRGDSWVGPSPTRSELESRLDGDPELVSVLFEESIATTVARYVSDRRIVDALCGQGVIGTWAGPLDPGTAQIKLMHHQGDLLGLGPVWGYVRGGIGRVSFALAEAATEAGAKLACGLPVARILPGEGVELESGELVRARTVVSNADPKRTLEMLLPDAVPAEYAKRLRDWDVRSPVVKLNAALRRLPSFSADEGSAHRGMVSITRGVEGTQRAFEAAKRGEPAIGFAELYFQTAYDGSVAPPDRHLMSVFAQYAPYEGPEQSPANDRLAALILELVGEHSPDVMDCIEETEVLAPRDIEARIGLTGGHIFQGQALPDQMWDGRLHSRTPVPGLYLCGAATHPGGSVIALNGRNAAYAVLEDTRG